MWPKKKGWRCTFNWRDAPTHIETDQMRLAQIVKNLLSNAFKFTSQGSVELHIYRPDAQTALARSGLDPAKPLPLVCGIRALA